MELASPLPSDENGATTNSQRFPVPLLPAEPAATELTARESKKNATGEQAAEHPEASLTFLSAADN